MLSQETVAPRLNSTIVLSPSYRRADNLSSADHSVELPSDQGFKSIAHALREEERLIWEQVWVASQPDPHRLVEALQTSAKTVNVSFDTHWMLSRIAS